MSVLEKNLLTLQSTASAARSNWSAQRSALLADALRCSDRPSQNARQSVRLRVYGESMLPTLWPGDVVEIAPCSIDEARPGEIVLALRDGRLFLHRLVSHCGPDGFLLCGDSTPGPDPLFPPEAMLGRLVRPSGEGRGFIAPALSRSVGRLLCHSGVARRLALKLHQHWKSSASENRHPDNAAEMEAL
jgi:hypothetical protein